MRLVDVSIESISPPPWNPNEMDQPMLDHLRCSIQRFGFVTPLVVRLVDDDRYETIGGAQRLSILKEMGVSAAPCVVVTADNTEARLLGQTLNHVAGSDNLGLRAQVLRDVLDSLPQQEVLDLLPETSASLEALTSVGHQSIAQALRNWEQIQKAKLRHLGFRLTDGQLKVVEEVLEQLNPLIVVDQGNPNRRGMALHLLCVRFLEGQSQESNLTSSRESS